MPSEWSLLRAGIAGFVLSLVLTRLKIGLSLRIGFVGKPGHRKIHSDPKPLGGGVAIFWSFAWLLLAGHVTQWYTGRVLESNTLPADLVTEKALAAGVMQHGPLLFGVLLAAVN